MNTFNLNNTLFHIVFFVISPDIITHFLSFMNAKDEH